ncbi:MAG: serine hydroxymethyltransferase [Hyphomicrobiaceae bacterium]
MSYLSTIRDYDPELHKLAVREVARQSSKICMIASENYASEAVYEAATTLFNNKYAEGLPRRRYYQGCEVVDDLEDLVIARLTRLFDMPNANVQPYSGSPANLSVYSALLKPGEKLLGMHLPSGGHLSHGWPVSSSGKFFHSCFYGYSAEKGITGLDPTTGLLDYDEIRKVARRERPQIIVSGSSSYPRTIDFAEFGRIAEDVGALMLADIAHISGLVAAKVHPSPSRHADVVSSTSHKLLRGPRGAFLLSSGRSIKVGEKDRPISDLIDRAVFPFLQGGAHYSAIAALAVALKEAAEPDFVKYAKLVVANARRLAKELQDRGFNIVTGGTDNHLMVIDVNKSFGFGGKQFAETLDRAGIVCNFNTVPADPRPPANPSGIRLGTPAITSRGFVEADMPAVADWIHAAARDESEANVRRIRGEIAEFCGAPRLKIPGLDAAALAGIMGSFDWRSEFG